MQRTGKLPVVCLSTGNVHAMEFAPSFIQVFFEVLQTQFKSTFFRMKGTFWLLRPSSAPTTFSSFSRMKGTFRVESRSNWVWQLIQLFRWRFRQHLMEAHRIELIPSSRFRQIHPKLIQTQLKSTFSRVKGTFRLRRQCSAPSTKKYLFSNERYF